MKTIWLCSWYPNSEDKFRGDFIQRHALAVSQFVQVDVIHIFFCDKNEETVTAVNKNLIEHIFYRKKKNKLFDELVFINIHQNFIKEYIAKNGKPDLVHVQIPIPSGRIALRWGKEFSLPYVLSEHYGIYNENVLDNYMSRSFVFKYFTKKIVAGASYFLPVSKSLGEDINHRVIKKDYHPIPNVVDTRLFHFVLKDTSEKMKFIHVSNFSDNKNVKGILDAISLIKEKRNDFEFIFIGNKRQDILTYTAQLNLLSYCTFVEEINYREVAEYIKKCHVGILFSLSESQSCVVLEWLCSGLPVISSAVGGVRELINETNGLLVPSQNIDELAGALNNMLDNYHNYNCKAIAENAESLYSYEAVGKKFLDTYKKIATR